MAATQALLFLAAQQIAVTLHPYLYDPQSDAVGLAAARALDLDPAFTLKTLMVEVDGRSACCVIPSDRLLSMKKVAAVFGAKQAAMMPPAKAEKLTGYRVGGISPFGQKRAVPTGFESNACFAPVVWVNAGQRGLLLGIDPQQALAALAAKPANLIA